MDRYWQPLQSVAHVLIAVCAVGALAFSIHQNWQIAGVVASAGEAFRAQSIPIVKFDHYQWNTAGPKLDCDNPAIGINVYYRNVSGVPVAIELDDPPTLDVRMGERSLAPAETTLHNPGDKLLAPGESVAISTVNANDFPDLYRRLRGQQTPPVLNATITVTYRSLVSSERYRYRGTVQIFDHCESPRQRRFSVGDESLTPLGRESTRVDRMPDASGFSAD